MPTETGLSGQDILSAVRQLAPAIEAFARQHYAWFSFAWLPDDASISGLSFDAAPSDHALGIDYLKANREQCSPLEQAVIEVSTTSPYSFYVVEKLLAEDRLQLREIYTQQVISVEAANAGVYTINSVLYTSILSVNGVSVLLGCMPVALKQSVASKIEAHREKWSTEEGRAIDRRLLYLHDSELRRFYFMLLGQMQRADLH